MADNPFDRFDTPADANPFDRFDAPAAAPVGAEPTQTRWGRLGQGFKDPIVAAVQMQSHLTPDSLVVKPEERSPSTDMLAMSMGGMPPTMTSKDIDRGIAQDEQKYQADRAASGSTGTDWWRMGGNAAATLPLSLAGGAPATLGAAMRTGAAVGAGNGLLSPVNDDSSSFWGQKAKQAGVGAVAGGATAPLGYGLSRLIQPEPSAAVRLLMDKGVIPTPGQIAGGLIGKGEAKLTGVPVLGSMISAGQGRALDQFNRAIYSEALAPIGEKSTASLGREGVAEVSSKLGDAYDKLLPQLIFHADPKFTGEIRSLAGMAGPGSVLPDAQKKQLANIIQTQVVGKLGPQGTMDGITFKGVESNLSRLAGNYSKSPSADDKLLGDALGEVLSSAKDALARANPAAAPELSKINQGYALYTRIRNAASKLGATGQEEMGVFTPSQYAAAVRQMDQSAGKGNFARGTALGQDLADAGKSVLASKYPDSGTAGRGAAAVLMGSLLSGGAPLAGVNPVAAGAVGTGLLAYTKPGQYLAAHALAGKRWPAITEPLADAIRAASVPAGGIARGLLSPLLP